MIQFNFVDVLSDASNERGFCPSSLIIVDKRDPAGTFKKVEESTFTCAKYDRSTLFDKQSPPTLTGNAGTFVMNVTKVSKDATNHLYRVKLVETKSVDIDLDLTFGYSSAVS